MCCTPYIYCQLSTLEIYILFQCPKLFCCVLSVSAQLNTRQPCHQVHLAEITQLLTFLLSAQLRLALRRCNVRNPEANTSLCPFRLNAVDCFCFGAYTTYRSVVHLPLQ